MLKSLQDYRSGFSGILERLVKGEFADTAAANQAMEPVKGPVRAMDKTAGRDDGKRIDKHSADQRRASWRRRKPHPPQRWCWWWRSAVLLLAGLHGGQHALHPGAAGGCGGQRAAERIAAHDLSQPRSRAEGRDETAAMMRGVDGHAVEPRWPRW